MALPAIAGTALSAGKSLIGGLPVVGGLLQSEDPVKNAERKRIIDGLATDAIRSGKGSAPYVHLACWAGASQGSTDYNRALALGFVSAGQPCRVGSDSMLVYAKARKLEVDARLAGAPILADAGAIALGGADTLVPGTVAGRLLGNIPPLAIVAGGAVLLWLILRK